MAKIKIKCDTCGKEFEKYESKLGKHNFCNKECYLKFHTKDTPTCVCEWCGKTFKGAKHNANKFCSRECYNKSLLNVSIISITKENIQKVINKYNTITDLAKHFNVSRPTMRKYLDEYDLLYEFKSKYDYHAKPVLQYDINMNLIKEWPSAMDAMNTTGIKCIDKCVLLQRKSSGGYI